MEHTMNIASRPAIARTPLGAASVDERLLGGLANGALHEIYGHADDCGGAAAFAFLVALRAAAAKPIFVIRDDRCVRATGRLHGNGVAALGGDPAAVIIVHTPDALATLRTAADAIACQAIGAVVVEPWDPAPAFDLTASRRIAWRAAQTGVFTLFVRHGEPHPSAAMTRWRVRRALSTALACDAPGSPAFAIDLLRHRGGVAGFAARVEWDRDARTFADALAAGVLPALADDDGPERDVA